MRRSLSLWSSSLASSPCCCSSDSASWDPASVAPPQVAQNRRACDDERADFPCLARNLTYVSAVSFLPRITPTFWNFLMDLLQVVSHNWHVKLVCVLLIWAAYIDGKQLRV